MEHLSSESISPLVYLKIFFRRKWLFLIPAFAGLILGICSGILLPKKYRTTTTILVEEGKTDNPLFDKLAVSTTVQQRMENIRESMLGWNSLVTLTKRLNLDKDVKSAYDLEQIISRIKNNVSIRLKGRNILILSYASDAPESTQAVVKNITDIFVERNIEIQSRETEDAIKFIEEQLKVYRGKIKSAEIAQLQDQLNALLFDSTEMHPRVKQLREEIAQKKSELEKENLQYTEDLVLNSQATNPIIDEIKKTLDSLETKSPSSAPLVPQAPDDIYKVMLIDKLDDVMARDVRVNETLYNMLLQRLETAKITQRLQLSKEGTKYTIVDPPRIPLKPFQPNKPLVAMIGLFLGSILGVTLVVMAEFLDKSFLDVQDTKNYLGIPLLGAISKIQTIDSMKEESSHQRWILSVTLSSGIAAIALSMVLAILMG